MPGADPADYAIRLGLWLAGREKHRARGEETTRVLREPFDRTSSAYTIAESDIAAALTRNVELESENKRLRQQNDELFSENRELQYGPTMSAEQGECGGCGCCTQAGCHRFADATCPTDSLGDSVCPCTED